MAETIECQKCYMVNPAGSNFCSQCGGPLSEEAIANAIEEPITQKAPPPYQQAKSTSIWSSRFCIIWVISLVILVAVLFVASRGKETHYTVGQDASSQTSRVPIVSRSILSPAVVGTYKSWGPTIVLENDGRVYGDCFYPRTGFVTWSLNGNIVSVHLPDGKTSTFRLSSDGKSLTWGDGTVFIKQ